MLQLIDIQKCYRGDTPNPPYPNTDKYLPLYNIRNNFRFNSGFLYFPGSKGGSNSREYMM